MQFYFLLQNYVTHPLLPQTGWGGCHESSIKTKFHTTKPCPVGLSPSIIYQVSPLLPKMSQNCCPHYVWTVSPFPEPGNPGDGEKSYPTAKNLPIYCIRKILLNRSKFFAVKSFISSPSNSNFQAIASYAVVICSW